MIMMGNKKDRGGALALIIDKMKNGSNDYESMKEENASKMEGRSESEDNVSELDAQANKIMEAFNSKDVSMLKESLKSFISMIMREK